MSQQPGPTGVRRGRVLAEGNRPNGGTVSRYTDFTLYWETWGGYPTRKEPFGLPNLTWFVATADGAMGCRVRAQPKDSMTVTWSAEWQPLPRELLDPLPGLLEEAGAFGQAAALVANSAAEGDYLEVWELSGALRDRPFHLTVHHTIPGEWPPLSLGRRLSNCLGLLTSHG